MRSLALVIVLVCSTATAAPVLVTKDNYKSAADSPFDLAGGGFWLEDFEDGLVNTPGLATASKVIAGVDGAVSIENGANGHVLHPFVVFDDLATRTWTLIDLGFDAGKLGGLPTSVGFVWTQMDASTVAASLSVFGPGDVLEAEIPITPVPFGFFGVTSATGIKSLAINHETRLPDSPLFQVDHVQYGAVVPEPRTLVLLLSAIACLGVRFRSVWPVLRFLAATLLVTVPLYAITTVDDPSGHVVSGGQGRDGVVEIGVKHSGGSAIPVSGTLLPTQRHVLTAAHGVTDSSGKLDATEITVYFHLAGGTKTVTANLSPAIAPGYAGNGAQQPDMAILRLNDVAPTGETYEIHRGSSEIGQAAELVGFGLSGKGDVGQQTGTNSVRRTGKNAIEAEASQLNGKSGIPAGTYATDNLLVHDFDNNLLPQNALFFAFSLFSDFGFLESGKYNEAFIALYDSGGPALIDGKIAGVARSRFGFTGTPDYLPGANSSWGEVGLHTRVSNRAAWYDSIVPPVVTSVTLTKQSGGTTYLVPTGSGAQLQTIPIGGVNRIVVKFSEDVSVSGTVVEVKSVGGGGSYPVGQSFLDARTLRLDITAPIQRSGIPGDKVLITFGNVKKTGTTGASLDGDWTNPSSRSSTGTSSYPSGNGTPGGGSFQFRVILLPGDFDRDNDVDVDDHNIWWANQGAGKTYSQGDADGDGDSDQADYNIWLANVGTNWTSW